MPHSLEPDATRPRLEHGCAPDFAPEGLDGLETAASDPDEPSRHFDSALLREPVSVLPVRTPLVFSPETPVADAVRAMQREHRGAVLVTTDGAPESRLIGIFTERDVLHRALERGLDLGTLPLGQVMTPDPERLPLESSVAWALNKMSVGGFRHVPIVDAGDRPAFVVSVRDVVELLVDAFPREVLNLPLAFGADRQRTREGA
jgi:CBS domain-containing protein